MSNIAVRAAAAASFALMSAALAGCALFQDGPGPTLTLVSHPSSYAAISQLPPLPPLPPPRAAASAEPEDFACYDGSTIHVAYTNDRNVARVSLNGAPAVVMVRADEDDLTAYRAQDAVLRRSGPRASLTSAPASMVVQPGDTLSLIAERLYGDRAAASEIARINQTPNPDLIYAGQTLRLPQIERQCRRTLQEASAYPFIPAAMPLQRRQFTPPSQRQQDLRQPYASAADPHR